VPVTAELGQGVSCGLHQEPPARRARRIRAVRADP
jgi:hypothetical protein